MYANVSSCSARDAAVRDLDPQHLVVAALALAVDAVVQAEDAERVLVDSAVEVLGDGVLEDVELFGDDRIEWTGREIADVDRHDGGSLTGGAERTDGRGPGGPGPSAGSDARLSSSRTSCGVRPMKMLAAPTTRRIMTSPYARPGRNASLKVRNFPDRRGRHLPESVAQVDADSPGSTSRPAKSIFRREGRR